MSKRNKIIYWIATIWLSLGMFSTGLVQLLKVEEEVKFVLDMGYPEYFLTIIGTWKILGVIAVLAPRFPLIKEWAYAGFFFTGFQCFMIVASAAAAFGAFCTTVEEGICA